MDVVNDLFHLHIMQIWQRRRTPGTRWRSTGLACHFPPIAISWTDRVPRKFTRNDYKGFAVLSKNKKLAHGIWHWCKVLQIMSLKKCHNCSFALYYFHSPPVLTWVRDAAEHWDLLWDLIVECVGGWAPRPAVFWKVRLFLLIKCPTTWFALSKWPH